MLTARTAPRRRRIQPLRREGRRRDPPGATYEIIHEDDDILVVDKGAGLLFVPGRQPHKHDSLISAYTNDPRRRGRRGAPFR